ncbi:MAG: MarR family winged helix-turn-helix transcriptional regulator [Acidobacteriota bacterium]
MESAYVAVIAAVERLHHLFMQVVKVELEHAGIRRIQSSHALIVFNLGDHEMTVGDLLLRGCYLGSNVCYGVKKLVEAGYVSHRPSPYDGRQMLVHLTPKGQELRQRIEAIYRRHVSVLTQRMLRAADLVDAAATLRGLDGATSSAADSGSIRFQPAA